MNTNNSSLASSREGSNSLLLSNMALKGAFERIERLNASCPESSSYDDEGFEDSKYIDCPAG